jgi:nucleotide-binding universal stress UspA family protein
MREPTTTHRIVVGVDGSGGSTAALDWALDEAHRRSASLCVVHALDVRYSRAFERANPVYVASERRAAQQVVDDAIHHARVVAPEVEVRPVLQIGTPAGVLTEQAAAAHLLVVGCRGRGGFSSLLLGSTSLDVATRASCAVVVVRSDRTTAGPSAGRIVVGSEGTGLSADALGFAFARARQRGLGLTVLRALRSPAIYVDTPSSHRWEELEKAERAMLSADLAPQRERYPDVEVVAKTVLANAAAALVEESAGAELLVVGSHGRGGLDGLLLGSVSHAVLHHAHCPVAVVRRPTPVRGEATPAT